MNILKKLTDNRQAGSYANKLRKKRFAHFTSLINSIPKPLKIIDIGGTEEYWEKMGFLPNQKISITILNLKKTSVKHHCVRSIAGDARDLRQFKDNSFDIAFSNSVIEHVGTYEDQQAMASEVKRLADKIYLQTPNKYFPLEPHFLFPFFQFLPDSIKTWLLMNFQLGWYPKFDDKSKALNAARSIRLLTFKELKQLFPQAIIHKEKMWGLTKSYVLLQGW